MKRALIILLITLFATAVTEGVTQKEVSGENDKNTPIPYSQETKVVIGDSLLSIQDNNEAFRLKIGNRGIEILESLEGKSRIKFEKYDSREDNKEMKSASDYSDNDDRRERRDRRFRRFKGHWAGFDIGFNNLLTDNYSFVIPDDIDYMSLHTGKSICFNLNFAQQSFGFTRHIGLVTGLGLNWNNYHFDGNNNIIKGVNGVITRLDPDGVLKKSKFTTLYITLPVMIELQIPTDSKQINLACGIIGGIKAGSHTKMVYDNGDKVKSDDDFSLNMLRYGYTARVGFENIHVYATYYPVALFKSGKSPGGYSLHPFEIGFAFTIND
ncbi:MAG TPA: outer membrane beta-barrel protein [Bacteroidales bacterium]|nr:outer membrane beta-barrel protein [Bacteroidales bacterium]